MEGFGKELFQYVTIQAVEYGVNDGLNQINNVDGGYGTGTLMGILGGDTTSGQLANISSQITVAQNMITSLQGDLDAFENQVASDENFIAILLVNEDYNSDIKIVNSDYNSLISLMGTYSNVVNLCFTNNGTNRVLKSNLSPSDFAYFTNFVTGTGMQTIPDEVLGHLNALTVRRRRGKVFMI